MTLSDRQSATASTKRAVVVHGLLLHLCSGYAVFLPFSLVGAGSGSGSIGDVAGMPMLAAVVSAALLIGLGIGFPLQSWVVRRAGVRIAVRLGLSCTIIAVILSTAGPLPWLLPVAALFAGAGLFGEWTPAADVMRGGLSSTQLWRGVRLHSMMLFAGALLATCVAGADNAAMLFLAGLSAGLLCLWLMLSSWCTGVAAQEMQRTMSVSSAVPPADHAAPAADAVMDVAATEASQNSEVDAEEACDAENCCGGGREWTPIPVWLGSCLAFVGMLAIGSVLPGLLTAASLPSAVWVLIGGLLGTVVFQGVVPTTGYAVLLAPCCLLGTIVFSVTPWLGTVWPGAWLTIHSAIAGAIYCGCSGLIGESFVDSCQSHSRTHVLLTGCMAAAAAGLINGVCVALISPAAAMLSFAAVCGLAILWLRKIPDPMVSQRREDEVSQADADALLSETFGVVGGSTK